MRRAWPLLTTLLCTLWAAGTVQAQVTVNLQALDALPEAKHAPKHPVVRKPAPKRVVGAKESKPAPQKPTETPASATPVATGTPAPAAATEQPATPAPAPPPATPPTTPPATVALAPVSPPAAETPAPPPPPPISDSADTKATSSDKGLRVTFGPGEADLSPASAAAIKAIVQSAPAGDGTSFNVAAYAAGTPEDPSTARRLSLSRALAVRSALMADGVSSTRIYVRALGSAGGAEAPDRVDLDVMGGNVPAATPASAAAPDASKKSPSQ